MPALKKFDANVARHVKQINQNLCANIIRHEYIVTGSTKAKRAQAKIEKFLGKALHQNSKVASQPLAERMEKVQALKFLQQADRPEIGAKVLQELSERYPERTHGFTRIIKLEPRLGEDKASMSVLELVDSEFEVKLWYTAKIVARLELQKLPLDDLTKHNVQKLTQKRVDGNKRFRQAVDEAKKVFFDYTPEHGVSSPSVQQNLQNKPSKSFYQKTAGFTKSKKYAVKARPVKSTAAVPKSPYLA